MGDDVSGAARDGTLGAFLLAWPALEVAIAIASLTARSTASPAGALAGGLLAVAGCFTAFTLAGLALARSEFWQGGGKLCEACGYPIAKSSAQADPLRPCPECGTVPPPAGRLVVRINRRYVAATVVHAAAGILFVALALAERG